MGSLDHPVSGSSGFKKCTVCDFEWALRDDFLSDRNIEIIGYQVHFEELAEGLFLATRNLFLGSMCGRR